MFVMILLACSESPTPAEPEVVAPPPPKTAPAPAAASAGGSAAPAAVGDALDVAALNAGWAGLDGKDVAVTGYVLGMSTSGDYVRVQVGASASLGETNRIKCIPPVETKKDFPLNPLQPVRVTVHGKADAAQQELVGCAIVK